MKSLPSGPQTPPRNYRATALLAVGATLVALPLAASVLLRQSAYAESGKRVDVSYPVGLSSVSPTLNELRDTPCFAEGKESAAASQTVYPIRNMPRVLLLRSGATLALSVRAISGLRRGGVWTAEYGDITPQGLYRTPAYMPPEGIDKITYRSPGTSVVRTAEIRVRLEADPARPESGVTPYVFDGSSADYGKPLPSDAVARHLIAPPIVGNHAVLVLHVDEKPPALTPVSYIRAIPVTAASGSGYCLPATADVGDWTKAIYTRRETVPPLREAREIPACFP